MKRFLIAALVLLSSLAGAQITHGSAAVYDSTTGWKFQPVAVYKAFIGAPTGACTSLQIAVNINNGQLYDCLVGAWNPIGSGGGGSSISLRTNGNTNSDQTILNLVASTGITLSESGGTVTLTASSPITLKTSGVNNGSQTTLNLAAGTGLNISDNGTGTITLTNPNVVNFKTKGVNNGNQTLLNLVQGAGVTLSEVGGAVTISASSPISLKTNNVTNGSQGILNLQQGTGVTLSDNGTGTVTINASGTPISVRTNGTPNGSQSILNLASGPGVSLTDNGTGTVTITAPNAGDVFKAPLANQAIVQPGTTNFQVNRFETTRYCDQFASVQACHDDLPANGGNMVLPQGTTTTGTVTISKDNVHIYGAGDEASTLTSTTPGTPVLRITGTHSYIEDLTISHTVTEPTCAGGEGSTTCGEGIQFVNGDRHTVRHVKLKSNYNGMYLNSVSLGKVFDTLSERNVNHGFLFDISSNQMQWNFVTVHALQNGGDGFHMQNPVNSNQATCGQYENITSFGNNGAGFFFQTTGTSSGIGDCKMVNAILSTNNGDGLFGDFGPGGGARSQQFTQIFAEQNGTSAFTGVTYGTTINPHVGVASNAAYGMNLVSCDATPPPQVNGGVMWNNAFSGIYAGCARITINGVSTHGNGRAASASNFQRAGITIRADKVSVVGGQHDGDSACSGTCEKYGVEISNSADLPSISNVTCHTNITTCIQPTTAPASGFIVRVGNGQVIYKTGAPSGACVSGDEYHRTDAGNFGSIWGCRNSVWVDLTGGGTPWDTPGTIGSSTPNTGSFTTLLSSGGITLSGNAKTLGLVNNSATNLIPNGSVGTTCNQLVELDTLGKAKVNDGGESTGILGVAVTGCGAPGGSPQTTGSVEVAHTGQKQVMFDTASPVAGHFAGISAVTGLVTDSGLTPASGQQIGQITVNPTNGAVPANCDVSPGCFVQLSPGTPISSSVAGNFVTQNPGNTASNTVQPTSSTAIALLLKQPSGGSVNVFQATDSTGANNYARVASDGSFVTGTGSGGSIGLGTIFLTNYADYLDLGGVATTPAANHIRVYNHGNQPCFITSAAAETCGFGGGGGAPALQSVTAAVSAWSISNVDNLITWNNALTGTHVGFLLADAGAAAGATELKITSAAGIPFTALANGNGLSINTSGRLIGVGTGSVDSAILTTVAATKGGTGLTGGTSGGLPYFNSATTMASSAALGANLPVFGAGAGAAPFTGTRSGNTTEVVTGTGTKTTGNCASWDANGNAVDDGAPCAGSGGVGSFVSAWCAGPVGTGNGSIYPLYPGAGGTTPTFNCTSGAVIVENPVPAACTAQHLTVKARVAGAVAGSGVITLYKNTVATALTCTLGTGTTCNDAAHTVAFAANDAWSVRVQTGQGNDTTADIRTMWQCK
jgi:hypothetical protein